MRIGEILINSKNLKGKRKNVKRVLEVLREKFERKNVPIFFSNKKIYEKTFSNKKI
jgi:hypothetical protein